MSKVLTGFPKFVGLVRHVCPILKMSDKRLDCQPKCPAGVNGEKLKCPGILNSFVKQNVLRVAKSFREACVNKWG